MLINTKSDLRRVVSDHVDSLLNQSQYRLQDDIDILYEYLTLCEV